MRHLSVLSCLVASGCFYTDTPNQRPSIEIVQTSSEVVYRTDEVTLQASSNDPEGQFVFYDWRVNACVDANDFATCTQEPFEGGKTESIDFVVPATLSPTDPTPTQSLRVVLEAQDEYGAIARPSQTLIIPVGNHPPTLTVRSGAGIVGTGIPVYVEIGDPDDTGETVTLDWTVFTPIGKQEPTSFVETNVDDPRAPSFIQRGFVLTAPQDATYQVQFTATDPLGATFTQTADVVVGPDLPPCLAQWAPVAAPAGIEAPLTEATLFQVSVVDDELDPYPAAAGDTFKGTPTFFWSLKENSGTRTDLAYQGNAVDLDPANYTVGDILELRVEITDRASVRPTCNDNLDTCAVGSVSSCIQRLTWRVEVR